MTSTQRGRELDGAELEPLMDASRAVVAALVRALAGVDAAVGVVGMRVLVLLWSGEPMSLLAVAERLGVNSSNASRTCDRLVRAGLVGREEQAEDRRRVALTLTSRGEGVVAELLGRRRLELDRIVARMSRADRRRLMAALVPFNAAAEADVRALPAHPRRDPRLVEWGL